MSSFTTNLNTRKLDCETKRLDREAGDFSIADKFYGGKYEQLLEEFDYHVGSKESEVVVHIPKGFITDFASVPRIFWNIMPPNDKYGKAAVVHDFLYSTNGRIPEMQFRKEDYTRKECDEILVEAMGVLDCGWLCRTTVYSGVRIGGWVTWANYKKKLERANKI